MMWRNRQIFYFQWRTLVFVTHESIFFIIMQILIFYFGYYHWDAGIVTLYPECVAAHPSDPDPPCQPQYLDSFWYFSIFSALLFAWLILFTLYMYWSNVLMWKWWYLLITQREVPLRESVFTSSRSQSKA